MKRCDYCGRNNEEANVHCTGCGTFLPEEPPAAITSSPIADSPSSLSEHYRKEDDVTSACRPKLCSEQPPPIPVSQTRRCNWCGREHYIAATCCSGCGTVFSLEAPEAAERCPPVLPPRLDARNATLILAVHLGVLFAVASGLGFIRGVVQVTRGLTPDFGLMLAGPDDLFAEGVILAIASLLGGLAALIAARRLAGEDLRDVSPVGAAWILGSQKQLAQGLALGFLLGVSSVGLTALGAFYWSPYHEHRLFDILMTPGPTRIVCVLSLLVIAPLVEELLFRGILYGGYRRSFGPEISALLTTGLFCLMHIPQIVHYPRALLCIAGVALAALFIRVRFCAIGPAVAVHYAYNATIILFVVLGTRVLAK